ncbi:aminotransferase class IV [Candidatus Aerophobetes bacterium]|nr:aminotransferase class IV [Candidatus Aerophobetes bacterium]
MSCKVFINGKFFPVEEAKISIQDAGFLFGYGLFETIRSYNGAVYKLKEHIERLAFSARFFKIPLPFSLSRIYSFVYQTIRENKLGSGKVKVILSAEEFPEKPKESLLKTNFIILVSPLPLYPQSWYQEGVRAHITSIRRNPFSPIYRHKTLNFLENILAKKEAEQKGCQEAIFLTKDGLLAEGSISNIFIVKKGKVLTPPLSCGILPGITRKTVIELCKKSDIPCQEKNITLGELFEAEEAFLTNSLREILPLCYVDSKKIGEGKVGNITRFLTEQYKKDVKRATFKPSLVESPEDEER